MFEDKRESMVSFCINSELSGDKNAGGRIVRSRSTYGEEIRHAYRVLVGETSRKGNILKCVLKKIEWEGVYRINLAEGRD